MQNKDLMEKLGKIESDISWIKLYLDKMSKRYAAKWVEQVVAFTLSGVGVAIIGALMGTILIPKVMALAQSLL